MLLINESTPVFNRMLDINLITINFLMNFFGQLLYKLTGGSNKESNLIIILIQCRQIYLSLLFEWSLKDELRHMAIIESYLFENYPIFKLVKSCLQPRTKLMHWKVFDQYIISYFKFFFLLLQFCILKSSDNFILDQLISCRRKSKNQIY